MASYPEVRSDHHHANSFLTAPSLCAIYSRQLLALPQTNLTRLARLARGFGFKLGF
jgi:hypothetical protein